MYNYSSLIKMLKEHLLSWKVWQIEVNMKFKVLHQQDNQTLGKFINILKALEQEIKSVSTNAQRYQNFLYSMQKYLRRALVCHNKIKTTWEELKETIWAIKAKNKFLSIVKETGRSHFDHTSLTQTFANILAL